MMMEIISKKKCKKKYLFHSSRFNLKILNPKHCKKVNGEYEHGKPTVHAFDYVTNEYCFKPVGNYKKILDEGVSWAHHKLKLKDRILFLGTKLIGYIYVLDGTEFYEIIRKDFMNGKWRTAKEYISYKKVKAIKRIKVNGPIDVENIKEYEYLGKENVGLVSSKKYLKLAKNEEVKNAVKNAVKRKFAPCIPNELKEYIKLK
jgi:hypothetical protein